MIKHITKTYDHAGQRITITPRIGGFDGSGAAAYCEGKLLTIGQNHDDALESARKIIDERLRHRSRLRIVEGGKMAGLGHPMDEWGIW